MAAALGLGVIAVGLVVGFGTVSDDAHRARCRGGRRRSSPALVALAAVATPDPPPARGVPAARRPHRCPSACPLDGRRRDGEPAAAALRRHRRRAVASPAVCARLRRAAAAARRDARRPAPAGSNGRSRPCSSLYARAVAVLVRPRAGGQEHRASSTSRSPCSSRLLLRGALDAAAAASCFGLTVGLALLFAVVGFVEFATGHLLLANEKVLAANDLKPYFRVNSLFFDPNIYGRFLALTMILLAARAAVERRGARDRPARAAALACCGPASCSRCRSRASPRCSVGLAVLAALRWRAGPVLALVGAALVRRRRASCSSPRARCTSRAARRRRSTRPRAGASTCSRAAAACSRTARSGASARAASPPATASASTSAPQRAAAVSHTIPVTVAAEQGVIGLLAYVALLVARSRCCSARRCARRSRRAPPASTRSRRRGRRRVRRAGAAHARLRGVPRGPALLDAAGDRRRAGADPGPAARARRARRGGRRRRPRGGRRPGPLSRHVAGGLEPRIEGGANVSGARRRVASSYAQAVRTRHSVPTARAARLAPDLLAPSSTTSRSFAAAPRGSARCPPRSRRTRTAGRGRAGRRRRTAPPPRCAACSSSFGSERRRAWWSPARARRACPRARSAAARSRRSARRRTP